MGKKPGVIPDDLKDKSFLASKAGSFSGVPLRTVQAWTEKGKPFTDLIASIFDNYLKSPRYNKV